MHFKAFSAAVFGIDAYLVEVEVDVGSSKPGDFNVVGLPDVADEHWRNANLRSFNQVSNFAAADGRAHLDSQSLPPPLEGFRRLVFVDGHPTGPLESSPTSIDAGGPPVRDADLRYTLLSALFGATPTVLTLHGRQSLELIYLCTGAAGSVYPRLELHLADNAQVTLLEGSQSLLSTVPRWVMRLGSNRS